MNQLIFLSGLSCVAWTMYEMTRIVVFNKVSSRKPRAWDNNGNEITIEEIR